jgi:glycosyltransferase involved in cell wall biosynthesis
VFAQADPSPAATDASRRSRRHLVDAWRPSFAVEAWTTWYDPNIFWPREKPPVPQLRIAWIGRYERQKDPLLAVDVLSELRRRGVDVSLTFLGAGVLRDAITDRIHALGVADHVAVRGAGDRESVAELLRGSHVLLSTSHYEGSPRVLIEALATGTPVAATGAADPDDLIGDLNGRIARDRSPQALADAVLGAAGSSAEACCASVGGLSAETAVPRLLEATDPTRPEAL